MLTFNSKLEVISPSFVNFQANVIDNAGVFSAYDVAVGDVIFINGFNYGYALALKYIVTEINSKDGSLIDVNLTWGLSGDPIDPIADEAIIGKPNDKGVIQIPDSAVQMLSTAFLNVIRNYQTDLLTEAIGTGGSIPDGVMLQSVYDKDADLKIDEESIPTLDIGQF